MEEILLDMRGLFKGLEVQGLVPLDQMPNISINTEELPTLQGWETGTVGQTPISTKLTQLQASEPAKEAAKVHKEPIRELESQPGSDSTLEESKSPQPSSKNLDNMTATARQIITENFDITQRMMEHLKT